MKVIFVEDVPKIAKAGDAKDVADGYGRNYLIPRKLAVLADSSAAGIVAAKLRQKAKRDAQTAAEMAELAKMLEGKEISISARSAEEGKLYGSVTTTDIADALNATGIVVDKKNIELAEPIHQLGSYDIPIRLTKDLSPKVKLTVSPKEGE